VMIIKQDTERGGSGEIASPVLCAGSTTGSRYRPVLKMGLRTTQQFCLWVSSTKT
jgi:hypothetical protein